MDLDPWQADERGSWYVGGCGRRQEVAGSSYQNAVVPYEAGGPLDFFLIRFVRAALAGART